ncbi:hypothetical protein HAPAU_35280 [Halalkalicoccus paucihalophilus]|uniref:Uncharacterized protein n=1 Tax=Halalkalicoccus paucihalophilus TaxID=1008153 RepID=A0A151AA80_9EURY|nr:hypothetical protein HAPAU_35280 [Halalkalicoccus paucihalophilus]
MNERLQYAVLRDALKVVARFTQSISSTDGVTDAESLSNEMIECNVTGFDIPSMFTRCEFDSRFTFDCSHSLLLDQCEVVPLVTFLIWFPLDKGSRLDFAEVAITSESLSSDRFNLGLFIHFGFSRRCNKNPSDGATPSHAWYAV